MMSGLGVLDDPDRYLVLARSLAEGRGFALNDRLTAYRPPLYPILLAPLVGTLSPSNLPWGVGAFHLALGVGMVLLVYATARRWGLSQARALIAAGVVAFDPVLVSQSRLVMTETLAAFLVALTLAALSGPGLRGAALGGFCFGLASLCRPSFLPPALLTAVASLAVGPGGWRFRIGRSLVMSLATFLTLLPWAQRNLDVFGEPVWTTTHGGYTLALANNWAYYQDVLDGPPDAVWGGTNQSTWMSDVARQTAGMSEPEADRYLRSEALKILKERPKDFARASVERLKRFWGISPSGSVYSRSVRWITTAWTVPLWVALVVGLCGRSSWRWPRVAGLAILLTLTLVHLVYWTDMRMRAPLIPAIALIAAGAWAGPWKKPQI
jgi:4-amino-4-deoxy-L-arabinose transferase-like glycosyltransferase